MSKDNETVGTAALEEILKSLQAAKDVTAPLAKGGVENSGTHGSGGKQGGGQGSEGDAGPIDNMMIAKMIQAGVNVQAAAAFQSFMAGKMSDEDDDDDDARKSASNGDLIKSFREVLSENLTPEEDEMVNVTPFLDGLSASVGESIDEMAKSLNKGQHDQMRVNKALSAAIAQMGTLIKSQASVVNALGSKLGIIERTPAAPARGMTGTAQPIEKSMAGEAGGGEVQLTKSQALSVMSYMNLVKGEREIQGARTSDLVTRLEAGGLIDQSVISHVESFVKSLSPADRDQAIKF